MLRDFLLKTIPTITVILALVGCAGSGSSPNSIASQCPVSSANPSAMTASYSIDQNKQKPIELSQDQIAAGTDIVVTAIDACQNRGPITSRIVDYVESPTPSGVKSYTIHFDETVSKGDLTDLLQRDTCATMITDLVKDEASGDTVIEESLPNDPGISLQKHLDAIGASEAYDIFYNSTTGIKKDVVIAVVDSGISMTHEDLRDHLWVNQDEVPNNGIDDDHNGYIDDVNGYNFASHTASPSFEKTSANSAWQYAHGTKVAGLAAAISGNGRGGTGVMGTAKIMALNNMGKGTSMAQSDTANAIRYAVDNGADVINLSLGGFQEAGTDYRNALEYALKRNVVVMAAAGNESSLISSNYSAAGLASSHLGLISIGNIKASDFSKSPTSNYSTTYVELGAPGTYTTQTGLYTTSPTSNSSYTYFSGTSAAVPVASGAAALAIGLIKSRGYKYTAAEIESLMLSSALEVRELQPYFQNGRALDLISLARTIDEKYPMFNEQTPPEGPAPAETNNNQNSTTSELPSNGETAPSNATADPSPSAISPEGATLCP